MVRPLKRVVYKYFGGPKVCIFWLICLGIAFYIFETVVLRHSGKEEMPNVQDTGLDSPDTGDLAWRMRMHAIAGNLVTPVDPGLATTIAQTGYKCNLVSECPSGKYAYHMKSGYGLDIAPLICFNGEYLVGRGPKNWERGLNMVVIDDKSGKVKDIKRFDTYLDDASMVRYLKLVILDTDIIILVSADEMTYNLHSDARSWLMRYGAKSITSAQFRDNYVMIGQRGLTPGAALELLVHRNTEEEFAATAELKGCLSVPLGPLNRIEVSKPQIGNKSSMQLGKEVPNCGLKLPCGPNTFPVHLYSAKGRSKIDGPRMCINGQYVLAGGVNDAGRGINIAVVDSQEVEVVRVGHFDTYAEDSSHLEIFLEMIKEGEIVLALTYDDAARKLSDHAKHLFNELGSAMVQNLRFRDNWFFVGQKGIAGFGDREQLEVALHESDWAPAIDRKMCVPTQLQGYKIKPDPLINRSSKRREFCSKYDGFGDFCDIGRIDEPLLPAPLTDRQLQGSPVFSTPIVVITGENQNNLRKLLETIIMQPGIDPKMVLVFYDQKSQEIRELIEVFSFIPVATKTSQNYQTYLHRCMESAWTVYPNKESIIVVEEDLLLGPDCLTYMAQIYPAVKKDPTLIGISSWNHHGYEPFSQSPGLVYRAETFPGYAFLLQRSFYDKFMRGKLESCCASPSHIGWFQAGLNGSEMIVPDVSRAYKIPGDSDDVTTSGLLFSSKRKTNLDQNVKITNALMLSGDRYEDELFRLIQSSRAFPVDNLLNCLNSRLKPPISLADSGKTFVIFYEQSDLNDFKLLIRMMHCFTLFHIENTLPKNIHRGILRFTYYTSNVLIIGSSSEYFVYKPPSVQAVSWNAIKPDQR